MTALSRNGLPPRRSEHSWTGPAGTWAYDRWGDTGRPVLLIHGPAFDRTMWWPVAAELADHCTVVAVDLPGHGQSPPWAGCQPADLLADLAQLTAGLGRRQAPVVVGHAASALLACLFAAAVSVRAAVTVGQRLDTWPDTGGARGLDAIPDAYRTLLQPRPGERVLAAYREWTTGVRPVVSGALRQASGPHVNVLGDRPDPGYPRWLGGLAPAARCVVYPRGGLFPHLHDVDRFAAEVRGLL